MKINLNQSDCLSDCVIGSKNRTGHKSMILSQVYPTHFEFPVFEFPFWWLFITIVALDTDAHCLQLFLNFLAFVDQCFSLWLGQGFCDTIWHNNYLEKYTKWTGAIIKIMLRHFQIDYICLKSVLFQITINGLFLPMVQLEISKHWSRWWLHATHQKLMYESLEYNDTTGTACIFGILIYWN